MKKMLVILFLLLTSSLYSQVTYRLFLNAQVQDTTRMYQDKLDRTDQIYYLEKKDSLITFKNQALEIKIHKKYTEFYFNSEFVGNYETEYWDCYTHIIIKFKYAPSEYFFFRIHSNDGTY